MNDKEILPGWYKIILYEGDEPIDSYWNGYNWSRTNLYNSYFALVRPTALVTGWYKVKIKGRTVEPYSFAYYSANTEKWMLVGVEEIYDSNTFEYINNHPEAVEFSFKK